MCVCVSGGGGGGFSDQRLQFTIGVPNQLIIDDNFNQNVDHWTDRPPEGGYLQRRHFQGWYFGSEFTRKN